MEPETSLDPGSARAARGGQVVSERMRKRLFEAAWRVYAEHGYHLTTVELILREAGVSRPTFYKLYANKQQVLDEVIKEAMFSLHV